MEQDTNRPAGMELRVAINALAQYSTAKGASESIRVRALDYVDQIEERTDLEKAAPAMYDALKAISEGATEVDGQCIHEYIRRTIEKAEGHLGEFNNIKGVK